MKNPEEIAPGRCKPAFGQKSLDHALGNLALEGLLPKPVDMADLTRIVAGELTVEQFIERLKERYGHGRQEQ